MKNLFYKIIYLFLIIVLVFLFSMEESGGQCVGTIAPSVEYKKAFFASEITYKESFTHLYSNEIDQRIPLIPLFIDYKKETIDAKIVGIVFHRLDYIKNLKDGDEIEIKIDGNSCKLKCVGYHGKTLHDIIEKAILKINPYKPRYKFPLDESQEENTKNELIKKGIFLLAPTGSVVLSSAVELPKVEKIEGKKYTPKWAVIRNLEDELDKKDREISDMKRYYLTQIFVGGVMLIGVATLLMPFLNKLGYLLK